MTLRRSTRNARLRERRRTGKARVSQAEVDAILDAILLHVVAEFPWAIFFQEDVCFAIEAGCRRTPPRKFTDVHILALGGMVAEEINRRCGGRRGAFSDAAVNATTRAERERRR